MTFLLDNLGATLIGGTVFLILLFTARFGQAESVETTVHYASSRSAASYGATLTRELRSLSRVVSLRETDGVFEFDARVTPGDTTQRRVVYRRVEAGSRDGQPLYRVQHTVDGALVGESPVLITDWQVEARRADGSLAASPSEAAQVTVSFEAAAPFALATDASEEVEQTRWATAVFPPFLRPTHR